MCPVTSLWIYRIKFPTVAFNTALSSVFTVMSNFKRAYGVHRVRYSSLVGRQQDPKPSNTEQLSVDDMNSSLLCQFVGPKSTLPVHSSQSKCGLLFISFCIG